LKEFLTGFYSRSTSRRGGKDFKYAKQISTLANRETTALTVELDDFLAYDDENEKLVERIEINARRFVFTVTISCILFNLTSVRCGL